MTAGPADAPAPRCTLVAESQRYAQKVVRSVRFDGRDLVVEIQGPGWSFAQVVFREVQGFRVLDERDLGEFWNAHSEPNGWLWEVHAGGWRDLERRRRTFDAMRLTQREYLLVDEKCISVLGTRPPEIVDLGADPRR